LELKEQKRKVRWAVMRMVMRQLARRGRLRR